MNQVLGSVYINKLGEINTVNNNEYIHRQPLKKFNYKHVNKNCLLLSV